MCVHGDLEQNLNRFFSPTLIDKNWRSNMGNNKQPSSVILSRNFFLNPVFRWARKCQTETENNLNGNWMEELGE
jgi:hypothetical protein